MNITSLEFSSFLTYSTRGDSEDAKESKTVMSNLKTDRSMKVGQEEVLASEYFAQEIGKVIHKNFTGYFHSKQVLVPVPNSSLAKPDMLWVSKRLANALIKNNLGKVSIHV